MKQPMAPMLSGHLLREANRFSPYPEKVRPTRHNLTHQENWQKIVGMFEQWRETFAPQPEDLLSEIFLSPPVLDEYYCRDSLKNVPSIVERTLKLKHVSLSGISPSEFVYLREAAKCYIYGLSNAAVALARAAMEECLDNKLAESRGRKLVEDLNLEFVIDDLARTKTLSREGRARAHKVRIAANQVLHDDAAGAPDALAVIEGARAVILEMFHR